jgi:hypothetical protein
VKILTLTASALTACLMIGAALSTGTTIVVASGSAGAPETVMITFRPKAGAEADLAKVIASHWSTALRLNLVVPDPHVTLRAKDEDGPYFVDIFTWRDAEIPDHAPPAIQAIWKEMNRLTQDRHGRPGLDITVVRNLTAKKPGAGVRPAPEYPALLFAYLQPIHD